MIPKDSGDCLLRLSKDRQGSRRITLRILLASEKGGGEGVE